MRELGMPWGFDLLADPLEGVPGYEDAFRVETRITQTEITGLPFTYWRVMPDSVIRIGYPSLGPLSVDVREEGMALVGTAYDVGDALMPNQKRPRPFTAHRIRCPTAPTAS